MIRGQKLQSEVLTAQAVLFVLSVVLAFAVTPSQGIVLNQNASATNSRQETSGCGPECLGRCFDGHCLFDDQGLSGEEDFEDSNELTMPTSPDKRSFLAKSSPASRGIMPSLAAALQSQSVVMPSATTAADAKVSFAAQRATSSMSAQAAATASAEFEPEIEGAASADNGLRANLDYQADLPDLSSSGTAQQPAAAPRSRRQQLLLQNSRQAMDTLDAGGALDEKGPSSRNMMPTSRARNEKTPERLQAAEAAVERLTLENSVLRDQLNSWRLAGAHVKDREAQVVQLLGHGDRPVREHNGNLEGSSHSSPTTDTLLKDRAPSRSAMAEAAALLPAAPSAPASMAVTSGSSDAGTGSTARVFGAREMLQLFAGKGQDSAFLPVPELFFFIEFVVVAMVLCAIYLFRGSVTSFLFGTDDVVRLLNFPRSKKYVVTGSGNLKPREEDDFNVDGAEVEEEVDYITPSPSPRR